MQHIQGVQQFIQAHVADIDLINPVDGFVDVKVQEHIDKEYYSCSKYKNYHQAETNSPPSDFLACFTPCFALFALFAQIARIAIITHKPMTLLAQADVDSADTNMS